MSKTQIKQEERATIRSMTAAQEKRAGKIAEKIQLQALKVQMVEAKLLKPNPYNPNKQSDEEFALLRQSIRSDGFTMPVLANVENVIIDGEHRWQAALAENIKFIPVVFLDVTDARMKIATIRHNKATGSHDAGLEAQVLADLEKLVGRDFIHRELMVDDKALDSILNFTTAADMLAGDDFNPSWEPVKNDSVYAKNDKGEPEAPPVFAARQSIDASIVLRSSTQEANTLAYRKVELKDSDAGRVNLFTVSALLNTEEAVRVKEVLENTGEEGGTPAERLLSIARQKYPEEYEKAHAPKES